MKPRILGFTTHCWHNEHAARTQTGWNSLPGWRERIKYWFSPVDLFFASGSWSNPAWNPCPDVTVVNAGLPYDRPYQGFRHHYGKMAFIAAAAFALNRDDWDYLVCLDQDSLVGAVDLPKLFSEFESSPAILAAPGWCGMIGGVCMIFKRWGAIRLVHHRPYNNFVDDNEPDMPLWEQECLAIYPGNMWLKIAPHLDNLMQENREVDIMDWPFVCRPKPELVEPYTSHALKNGVPL